MQRDTLVFDIINQELQRQRRGIELIASENFTSLQVMQAMGGVMTNKYAEGYPGRRYYGGCEIVDKTETLAIDRLKEIFGLEYANVQPHSGAQANAALMLAILQPGDAILGLDLSMGGHLTHGSSVNFSGKTYTPHFYGVVKETGLIDYEMLESQARAHKPKLIICGASAYSRDIDYARIRKVADEVGAFVLADIAHPAGLIAKGHLMNPVPYCDIVTSTTHKTLRGPRGGIIMMGNNYENPFGLVAPKSGRIKQMGELIDSMVMPGIQGGPLMHVIAAKAIAFQEALSDSFHTYTTQVVKNASTMAQALLDKGYNVVSGGTDNHLMLIDLRNKNLTGKQAELALDKSGITCNKNAVPYDTQPPLITSGIRLGAAAMTSRGFKEQDMKQIAEFIDTVLSNISQEGIPEKVKQEVKDYCKDFSIYPSI